VAWVVGKFKLAAKNQILIIVEHAVLMLVTHRYRCRDRHFENAGAAFVIQQHSGKTEALDYAINHSVGALTLALHAQAMAAMNQLVHHRFGEPMLNFE